jgi:hypothetical protein
VGMNSRWRYILLTPFIVSLTHAGAPSLTDWDLQRQKEDTCTVLAANHGLHGQENTPFLANCIASRNEPVGEDFARPTRADVLVANDLNLAALAYRLFGMLSIAERIADTKELKETQEQWNTVQRERCKSPTCLAIAYRSRLGWMQKFINEHADSFPQALSAEHEFSQDEEPDCGEDRHDSFGINMSVAGNKVTGDLVGSGRCTARVAEADLVGTIAGHIAIVRFEAGFTDAQQAVEALIVTSRGRVYWQLLTDILVEDYVWRDAQMDVRPSRRSH